MNFEVLRDFQPFFQRLFFCILKKIIYIIIRSGLSLLAVKWERKISQSWASVYRYDIVGSMAADIMINISPHPYLRHLFNLWPPTCLIKWDIEKPVDPSCISVCLFKCKEGIWMQNVYYQFSLWGTCRLFVCPNCMTFIQFYRHKSNHLVRKDT